MWYREWEIYIHTNRNAYIVRYCTEFWVGVVKESHKSEMLEYDDIWNEWKYEDFNNWWERKIFQRNVKMFVIY